MDRLIDIFSKWEPLGQGIFILIILAGLFAFIETMFGKFVILFRGYRPFKLKDDTK